MLSAWLASTGLLFAWQGGVGCVKEKDWAWARPTYTLTIDAPLSEIEQLRIDPSGFMADIDLSNNVFDTAN